MSNLETGYQPLLSQYDNDAETPHEEMMIHVVPEGNKSRWNHIEDLDSFFTRVYHYHQKHGFTCMMVQQVLELMQFAFVVIFTMFLAVGVNYTKLFRDGKGDLEVKIVLWDVFLPITEWSFNATIIVCLLVAIVFWILRAIKVVYHIFQYMEIKAFYSQALKIESNELGNMTWHDVQQRVMDVQKEQQMCIHKEELTELDIYHRILRFKNYMVAMVNKSVLPFKFNVPLIGEVIFITEGLKYNLELLLFYGPWAPFENNWHLKADYKKVGRRKDLAKYLSKRILWVGIANFLLCPLILLWQLLYLFFNYAEMIKREPGHLGARKWSMYGRLYLRHFNELDHELNARLCRAYKPATMYTNIFVSHIMSIVAKNITFFSGSILAVLLILTAVDEDVLTVGHVFLIITISGVIIAVCRPFIPDEHLVWCPEKLMVATLAHIHYMPDEWKGNAHTLKVRNEFTQLFQYRAVYILEQLLSPIVTPIILCFFLRHKALEIVDFFRNFTVEVVGVGDVCSFAQMDVRRHGNPQWSVKSESDATQYQQAEDGKTELSLMHFTLTNPHWKPPVKATEFLESIREQVHKDQECLNLVEDNPLYNSLHSISSLGAGVSNNYHSLVENIRPQPFTTGTNSQERLYSVHVASPSSHVTHHRQAIFKGGVTNVEGPQSLTNNGTNMGIFSSLYQNSRFHECANVTTEPQVMNQTDRQLTPEITSANMSLSTLYLHELRHQNVKMRNLWRKTPGYDTQFADEEATTSTPIVHESAENVGESDLLLKYPKEHRSS